MKKFVPSFLPTAALPSRTTATARPLMFYKSPALSGFKASAKTFPHSHEIVTAILHPIIRRRNPFQLRLILTILTISLVSGAVAQTKTTDDTYVGPTEKVQARDPRPSSQAIILFSPATGSAPLAPLIATPHATLFTAQAAVAPTSTYFLENDGTLSNSSSYYIQEFTLSTSTTLMFRLVSDYKVDAGIFLPENAQTFISGGATTGYALFNGKFGTNSITLAAGSYVLAIRNGISGANKYRYELDYDLTVPGMTLVASKSYVDTVPINGGKYWVPFTIASDQFAWVDGCNLDLDFYVIQESQLPDFRAGNIFNYYTSFTPITSSNQPGGMELNLAPGSYYLAFKNNSPIVKPVTLTLEYWASASTSSGGGGGAPPPAGKPADGGGGGGGGGAPSEWFYGAMITLTMARTMLRKNAN